MPPASRPQGLRLPSIEPISETGSLRQPRMREGDVTERDRVRLTSLVDCAG
jgi:hypothetical protein